ncbi:MAG: MBL fold metallo-hydrolase, partial [Methanolinea sp.]|nr:MBL fold metallo-hydrolase [Methanolinea sp.]
RIRMGDRMFEVVYMSGHSSDSVCFFCEEDGILFAGDAPLVINSAGGTFEEGFIRSLGYLCRKDVRVIYFGHGEPLSRGCRDRLEISLRYAGMSTIRSEGT